MEVPGGGKKNTTKGTRDTKVHKRDNQINTFTPFSFFLENGGIEEGIFGQYLVAVIGDPRGEKTGWFNLGKMSFSHSICSIDDILKGIAASRLFKRHHNSLFVMPTWGMAE